MNDDSHEQKAGEQDSSFLDELRRKRDADKGREPQLYPSRAGRRMVSINAMLERIISAFLDEHGTDSAALQEADTEAKRLKLLLGTVDYVLAVEVVSLEPAEKAELMRRAYAELFAYSVLEPLLADEAITTILLEGADKVSVRVGHGDLIAKGTLFDDEGHLLRVVGRLLADAGTELNPAHPIIEAGLRVRGRPVCVNVAQPPVVYSLTVDLRVHPARQPSLETMVEQGIMPSFAAALLTAIARSSFGVVVVGEAESGKTTLLAALAHLADHAHMIAVERAGEMHLPSPADRLVVRWPTADQPGVTFGEQIGAALAARPTVMVLDEVRADEPQAITPLLAADQAPRQMWAFRGPSDSKRLAAALGMVARRGDPARSEHLVQQLYRRLPFVVMLRRTNAGLKLRSIAEWQFPSGADYPDFVELIAPGWDGLERTGKRPACQLHLPTDFWEK